MGMYNEVFYPCPKCHASGMMQVSQFVLGFGNFHLTYPNTLLELTKEEMEQLKSEVLLGTFVCPENQDGCGHEFNPYVNEKKEEIIEFANNLFKT